MFSSLAASRARKWVCLLLCLFLSFHLAFGAQSDGKALVLTETPARCYTASLAVKQFQTRVTLPRLDRLGTETPRAFDAAKGKLQIGLRRNLDEPAVVDRDRVAAREWLVAPDGTRIWSAEVSAPGALGLRLHLQGVKLPAGAQLVVAATAATSVVPVSVTRMDLAGNDDLWMPSVMSDRLVLECQVPPGADLKEVAFSVTGVSHLYATPTDPIPKLGGCHNDVTCYPAWAQQAAGVARISFVELGDTYVCTAGMLSDNDPASVAAYLMTAKHCVGSQVVASTLEVFWLFQASSCLGYTPPLSTVPVTAGGADLLARTSINDLTLVRLRRSAPDGTFRLGWTTQPVAPMEEVTTIHHPDGQAKKISFGVLQGADSSWWKIRWTSGVTEPGSSGAPLFNSSHQVVGFLYGGSSSCSNPNGIDNYGRLDLSYDEISKWLGAGAGGTPPPEVAVARGTYIGSFRESGALSGASAGLVTVTVAADRKFTGNVRMKSGTYPFSGSFSPWGWAVVTVKRGQWPWLTMDLYADAAYPDHLAGTVDGGSWTAEVAADRAPYDSLLQVAPQSGKYTLGLPGVDNEGHGFALGSITKAGQVMLSGKLPDGTSWTFSSRISGNGLLRLFTPSNTGLGLLFGTVMFPQTTVSDPAGTLDWMQPVAGGYGQTVQRSISVIGSRVTAGQTPVALFSTGTANVSLSGAGLNQPIGFVVQLKGSNKAVSPLEEWGKVTLTFTNNGAFGGHLSASPQFGSRTLQGVVLQSRREGFGLFKYGKLVGKVSIQP